MSTDDPIAGAMRAALERGVFPGAVLLVRLRGRVAYHRAFGLAARLPVPEPATLDTIYDLASLTKPLATATAVLCLTQDGRLGLDTPIQETLDELAGSPVGAATIRHLLSHRAGLPAWRPLYQRIALCDRTPPGLRGRDDAKRVTLALIRDETLQAPPGTQGLYSDLGFILLGFLVERVTGMTLAEYCRQRVYDRVGAGELFFIESEGGQVGRPAGDPADPLRIAATEQDPWRGRLLRGEVHDENAWALGGVAGHSGLFGTADAVAVLAGRWLEGCLGRPSRLSPGLVRNFLEQPAQTSGASWASGWDRPSPPSAAGARFSARSFGHLGFTGTSVWVDPAVELEVVFLSNRVHPSRANDAIRAFRPQLHDLIYKECVEGGADAA
jgi:CubicO group peptidase (beta-lactamase class C family)